MITREVLSPNNRVLKERPIVECHRRESVGAPNRLRNDYRSVFAGQTERQSNALRSNYERQCDERWTWEARFANQAERLRPRPMSFPRLPVRGRLQRSGSSETSSGQITDVKASTRARPPVDVHHGDQNHWNPRPMPGWSAATLSSAQPQDLAFSEHFGYEKSALPSQNIDFRRAQPPATGLVPLPPPSETHVLGT